MCLIPNLIVIIAALIIYFTINNIWAARKKLWKVVKAKTNKQLEMIGREDLKLDKDR